MRVLLIGNSNDSSRRFEGGKLRHEIAGEMLSADLDEDVEFVVKGYWPNSRAPELIGRWIDETDPDVIYLQIGNYPFQYRSVPLRVRRLFRRVGGDTVATAGEKAGRSPRVSHNWAFRAGRRFLQRTVGGDTNFTREHVWQVASECVRIGARKEGAIFVVRGPHGRNNYAFSRRQFRRDETERIRFHEDLERLCEQMHITYDGIGEGGAFDQPVYRDASAHTIGDGIHGNARRHQSEGEVIYRGVRKGLVAAGRLGEAGEPAAACA